MEITLLHHTPLNVCSHAIRTCWQSFDKSDNGGEKDKELIDRVGNKLKHASTLEHLVYSFYIQGISRACLQELARHRIASMSVKSTRYTLKELKEEEPFISECFDIKGWLKKDNTASGYMCVKRAKKYIVFTGNETIDYQNVIMLEFLRQRLNENISNDIAKYALPECYKTELTWTINARSLQNFLELRSSKSALWEIRDLAHEIYNAIPDEHKYLFKDYLKQDSSKDVD